MVSFAHSSKTVEWYTPPKYIEAARLAMGSIDLDPASCDLANDNFVKASNYFTEDDDGLSKDWFGNVFCNPPYGRGARNRSNQAIWLEKAVEEVNSGRAKRVIALVNAVPDRSWFQPMFDYTICFVSPRIKFINHEGIEKPAPPHGSCFILIEKKSRSYGVSFSREFAKFGRIVQPVI